MISLKYMHAVMNVITENTKFTENINDLLESL